MVKKFTASPTQLQPDTRYKSKLVSKFINCLMYDGKKSVASRAMYSAMDMIQKQLPGEDPLHVFTAAVDNVKPAIEVRSRSRNTQPESNISSALDCRLHS